MRMKGITPPRARAGLLVAWLACVQLAAAQNAGSPAAPDEQPRAARDTLQTELGSRPSEPRDPLAGGGRAAAPLGALPAGAHASSTTMERHDWAVGAIDPDHDDAYEYRLPYGDAESYPVIQGYGS